jgi:AcrR family transcriptional regulator
MKHHMEQEENGQTDFKRARNEKQKEIRAQQIVEAALILFDTTPYEHITLTMIAEKLDFTRANLYQYFATKEAIFLTAINQASAAWMADIFSTFEHDKKLSNEVFAEQLARTVHRNKRFFELISTHINSIGKDVSNDPIMNFAFTFSEQQLSESKKIVNLFCGIIPNLSEENAVQLTHYLWHYAIGLCIDKLIIAAPQNALLRGSSSRYAIDDFTTTIKKFLIVLLTGLLNTQ